ncbi:FAD-dependent oxidoreductase [Microbacterium sp. NPDC055910]|uniref:oxidoreductase n=1 Tax=Microbacterium sp. NPDC055910 TaxID=3345659 RepID=UPI0035E0D009
MSRGPAEQTSLFEPLRIGPLTLRSRVVMPPHSSAIGNLWGKEEEAEKALAYLRRRAQGEIAWATMPGRVSNILPTGFEPQGLSAVTTTPFRFENYVERTGRFVDVMHEAGSLAATQLTLNGGYPHAPSARFGQKLNALAPHVLSTTEIDRFVDEYAHSSAQAFRAGIDVLELHMNHEDLTMQFASAQVNGRTDEYGGSFENRLRFPLRILRAARAALGAERALGVRFNGEDGMFFSREEGIEIAQHLVATGLIDYVHIVHGNTWGNPSYIQPHFYEEGAWSHIARDYREALSVPVLYTGLISSAQRAAEIVAAGDADAVGMARAHLADPDVLVHAKNGTSSLTRPCVGVNDCINRRYTDGLPFACGVNPHAGDEGVHEWHHGRSAPATPVTVVGGGPGGMEIAALLAEAGAKVTLFEAGPTLGGQLAVAAHAPSWSRYDGYLRWQHDRLRRLGVDIRMRSRFTEADLAAIADGSHVVFATGSSDNRTELDGSTLPHVHTASEVLTGTATPRGNVVLIAHEDHLQPFAVAEKLAVDGATVTMFYQSPAPGQLLGRYSIGAVLGRMDALGVRVEIMTEVTGIDPTGVDARNIFSGRTHRIDDVDHVVVAAGGVSDAALWQQAVAEGRVRAHIVGDAYAQRRLVNATRQALAVAKEICPRTV